MSTNDLLTSLSQREREVLQFVAGGFTSREIARWLHLSPRTVEMHRIGAKRKLGLKSQPDVISFYHHHGITAPKGSPPPQGSSRTPAERQIVQALDLAAGLLLTLEDVADEAGLNVVVARKTLLRLETLGLVQRLESGHYLRR